MSITAITRSLPGERVIQLSPEDATAAAVTWLRRPNLFPGRTLTAPTLEARSLWASGHIAQRGQAFTAGVVRGLQVGHTVSPAQPGERPRIRLQIAAGQGLAIDGEDLVVHEIDADFWSLPVVAPPDVLEGGAFGGGGVLQPRAIGLSLGDMLTQHPGVLPRAGVLVLQPVLTERANIDADDPCDRCGCGDADSNVSYEDWRLVDGARLLWYAWPEDWEPAPPADAQFRNRLAFKVFDAERRLAPGETLPWESFGVALALMGVDDEFVPGFIDHASVARRGGRGRYSRLQLSGSRFALATNTRLPSLWQAQIEQLAEHINALGDPSPPPATLAQQFDRLPPCGLLPRTAIDWTTRRSDFFPDGMDLDAVPVPMEQLDLAIRESAGLDPLDLARGERVRVLVPVSQASYEPRLLMTETIDPEFNATLDRFLLERSTALAGRQGLRLKAEVLVRALRGTAPPVPAVDDDPLALETESTQPWGPPSGAGGHRSELRAGVHEHAFDSATTTMVVAPDDVLYAWVHLDPDAPPRTLMLEWRSGGVDRRAYWGDSLIERGEEGTATRLRIGDLPAAGRWVRLDVPAASLGLPGTTLNGMGFVLFDGRAAFAASGRMAAGAENPWFDAQLPGGAIARGDESFDFLVQNELLAPFESHQGVVPAAGSASGASEDLAGLAASTQLTALLSAKEQAQLPVRGVEGFIAYLKARADRADDIVDYGFVKVQTDLYRVRQLVLGTTEATRLAISPALAGIAQAETAVATHERITDFIKTTLRKGATSTPTSTPVGSSTRLRAGAGRTASTTDLSGFAFNTFIQPAQPSVTTTSLAASTTFIAQPELTVDRTLTLDAGTRLFAGVDTFIKPDRISPIGPATTYTPVDVVGSAPLAGNINLRTLSLAERLNLPHSQKARDYSTSTRHETVLALIRLADQLTAEDGEVPGLFDDIDVWGLTGDQFVPPVSTATPLRRPLKDFISLSTRATLFNQLLIAPEREQADEASYFSDSADMADRTIALFRQVEGRIKRYREAIAACEAARDALYRNLAVVGTREYAWSERLAEARHDVSVARALIAEEQARIDAINVRRTAILESEVRFVAYIRPRTADNLMASVSRPLDPGLLEAPVPTCLQAHADMPDELTTMLAVLREAPAAWFAQGPALLDRLDRIDLLVRSVATAQLRSAIALERAPMMQLAAPRSIARSGLGDTIAKVQFAQKRVIDDARGLSRQINIAQLANLTWQGVRVEAAKVVSLGDLIDGEHGQGLVARNAAAFFDRFSHVCGCLHAGFSAVLPSIRLDWAEALSQFDDAPNLRNLGGLQRWAEIDHVDRRRLQGLVDWLFDQIHTSEPRAHALLNDIVRMCLLLASHAPVGRIIAGRLPRPVTARPGVRIPLVALDPPRLRIGMHALVYRADRLVARAVVEDLGSGEVSARVVHTAEASVELDQTMRVQFAETASVSMATTAKVASRRLAVR